MYIPCNQTFGIIVIRGSTGKVQGHCTNLLSTEWVDYTEEPMKYQALRPHSFFMGGWGWWGGVCGVLMRDVVGGGGRVGGGMGDGVLSG